MSIIIIPGVIPRNGNCMHFLIVFNIRTVVLRATAAGRSTTPADNEPYVRAGTSWLKANDPIIVSRECPLQYLLECHIFGIIHTDHHEQRKSGTRPDFSLRGPRAGASGGYVSRPTASLPKDR